MSITTLKNHFTKRSLQWYICIVILLKALITSGIYIYAITVQIHDDQLMIEMAYNLLNGNWLGDYNNRTLVKGITYPLFLVFNYNLGLPYTFTLTVIYGLVCWLFTHVLHNFFHNKVILGIVFTFLYFLPSSQSLETLVRVYRNALAPVLALLVIAILWKMYFRRNSKWNIAFFILAGLCFALFWNLREDSIWLMPVFIVGCIVTIIQMGVDSKLQIGKFFRIKLLLPIIPLVVFTLCNVGIKAVNYHYYGVFVRNELSEGGFASLMKAIYSVEPDEDIDQVSTPKSTVDQLYEASPSFATLQAALDGNFNAGWDGTDGAVDGQIRDGWFFWCLRDCIVQSGYTTPKEINNFCQHAADEINQALNDGILERRSGMVMPTSIMSPWKPEYATKLPLAALDTFAAIARYEGFNLSLIESIGNDPVIRETEVLTHNFALYPGNTQRTISLLGWIASYNDDNNVEIAILRNGVIDTTLAKTESSDVYSSFQNSGMELENTKQCRIQCTISAAASDTLEIGILQNGELINRVPLTEDLTTFGGDSYLMQVDNVSFSDESSHLVQSSSARLNLLEGINTLYQKTGVILTIFGCLSYVAISVVLLYQLIAKRLSKQLEIWLLLTSLLLSVIVLCCGIGYTTISSYNAIIPVYIVGGVPLLSAFNITATLYAFKMLVKLILARKAGGQGQRKGITL